MNNILIIHRATVFKNGNTIKGEGDKKYIYFNLSESVYSKGAWVNITHNCVANGMTATYVETQLKDGDSISIQATLRYQDIKDNKYDKKAQLWVQQVMKHKEEKQEQSTQEMQQEIKKDLEKLDKKETKKDDKKDMVEVNTNDLPW